MITQEQFSAMVESMVIGMTPERERMTRALDEADAREGIGREGDRLFLERNPDCNYLERLATAREAEAIALVRGSAALPADWFWFASVLRWCGEPLRRFFPVPFSLLRQSSPALACSRPMGLGGTHSPAPSTTTARI